MPDPVEPSQCCSGLSQPHVQHHISEPVRDPAFTRVISSALQTLGKRFYEASTELPLFCHEPYRQARVEQEREIELDQKIKSNLPRAGDRLR